MTETSDVPLYTDNRDKPLFSETPEEREFELRAAVGSYWTGGRLLIGMFTFLFASLAFAYFYLKSNNSGKLWRPDGITAPTGIGWTIFAVVLASVLLTIYGQWRMRAGSVLDWEVSGWVAVAGLLLATGLQVWQLTQLPFFPGSSGYASCFIAWAVLNIMLLLGGAVLARDQPRPVHTAQAARPGGRVSGHVDGPVGPTLPGQRGVLHLLLRVHSRDQRAVLGVLLSDLREPGDRVPPPRVRCLESNSEVGPPVSTATDTFIGPQVLTVAIPLGTLFVVMLWGFFQRRTNRR